MIQSTIKNLFKFASTQANKKLETHHFTFAKDIPSTLPR